MHAFVSRLRRVRPLAGVDEHSLRRYRGILLGGGAAGFSKFISLLSVAFSVPLTVRYLGTERYGMWMTISSLIAMLSFADMGIGSGLVSAMAALDGKRELDNATRLVSSAFYMLVGVGAVIAAVFLLLYPFLPWARIFGVTDPAAAAEAGPSMFAFVLCFVIGLPFTVVQRVQTGLQESWRANLWQAAGSMVSLVGVLLAAWRGAGVMWLVLAMNGGQVVIGVVNSVIEFSIRKPALQPRFAAFDMAMLKDLLGSSAIFVALQLCVLVGGTSDSIILAQMFGAAAVGPYAVMYKLFQTSLVFSLFMYPLWPAFGEALARGDYGWARVAFRRAVQLSSAAGLLLALILLVGGKAIVRAWVGSAIIPDTSLVAAFSAWTMLVGYAGAVNSLLNNSQFLRLQLKIYGAASVAALLLKVPLAHWVGPAGVVWASVLAYSAGYCVPASRVIRRFFRSNTQGIVAA